MKIGDTIIDVDGVRPSDLEEANPKVNKAFRKLLGLVYPAMRLTFDTKKTRSLYFRTHSQKTSKNLND